MMTTRRSLLALFGGLVAAASLPVLTTPAEAQPARAPSMPNADSTPGPAGDLLPRAGNRRRELTNDRFGRRQRRRRYRGYRRSYRRARRRGW